MWIGVRQRFGRFNNNLVLTDAQEQDGITKAANILTVLENHYYGVAPAHHGRLVGSWGKKTNTRPPRDVDMLFELSPEVYHRFQGVTGNRQSQLLQEVRGVLIGSYPQTTIRGDGQVVDVRFNTIAVDVVPAFQLTDGRYWICDTNGGGRYKLADPLAQIAAIATADDDSASNLRRVIKMLKAWKRNWNVELKSFILEIIATRFMAGCPWKKYDYFWYDWIMRDFFAYLVGIAGTTIIIPGTGESYALGYDWKSKAESARDRSLKACAYEYADYVDAAGEEWQKIFGTMIPQSV
jgi:hypothetical protein